MQKPNVFKRVKAAFNFYRNGWRHFDIEKRESKKAPFILPAWRNNRPMWQLINFETYAQEGFNENAILYSAVMYKVRAITAAPLRAYTGTIDDPELLPADHPLQKLVSRPNQWQSWAEFQGQAETFLNIAGNVYVVIDRQPRTKVPRALYLVRPDRMFIVPQRKQKGIIGYLYIPEGASESDGVPFLSKDIIHIKLPNPLDPLEGMGYGLSPVSCMARSIDVDNSITSYLGLFFQNGAMPPGLLSFDVPLDDPDIKRIKDRWMEIYGGYDNWSDIGVLDNTGSYQKIGLSFQELDMSALDARNESRTVAPLGVPLTLIESRPELVQSTYSNKREDREMFWEDTMVPELRWFETDYQFYIQGDNGEFVMFDLSKVPALQMSPVDLGNLATSAFENGGIGRDEYRSILPFELGDEDAMETESQAGMVEAESMEDEQSKAVKKLTKDIDLESFARKTDELAVAHESDFEKGTMAAFENDRRRVLAIVKDADIKARELKQTLDFTEAIANIDDYYRVSGQAASNWTSELDAAIDALVDARVVQLNGEFGFDTPPQVILSQDWLTQYKLVFSDPINDTSADVITTALQQGINEGWSTNKTVNNLGMIFDQWKEGKLTFEDFVWLEERSPFHRTEAIVRTETIRASNAAANATYGVWGAKEKEWLATGDDRTRDSHVSISGKRVPIDGSFNVGGSSLRFPGDPQGSTNETVNCRCTIIPIL